MLREIIIPTSEFYTVHIPREYINHEVEIVILPFYHSPNKSRNKKTKNKSLAGVLNKYANLSLIENEKEIAWEQVAKDKNDLS